MKRFTITRLLELSALLWVGVALLNYAPAWVWVVIGVLGGIALLPVLAIGVIAGFYYPIAQGVKLLGRGDKEGE
ncbi:hypothetical protein NG895_03380 [Aeoliella sp. ICT_H6.2]|uniref:Uncharacterized protein n=1 Tax=Aeoliella straminimaris TaxID=2954799 RepID=A0A9X2JF58_9BACT|nr:hypothetical protein [Aeoliella straminimaris]MCO6042942.1 hypothetical protein [Aeoliella straminimaris]